MLPHTLLYIILGRAATCSFHVFARSTALMVSMAAGFLYPRPPTIHTARVGSRTMTQAQTQTQTPQTREPQVEPQVEEIINMYTFQQLLQKIERLLKPKEVWCYNRYVIEQIGDPPVTVLWDPTKDRFWPGLVTMRDHTGCPGYRPVVTLKQLTIWLTIVALSVLERLNER